MAVASLKIKNKNCMLATQDSQDSVKSLSASSSSTDGDELSTGAPMIVNPSTPSKQGEFSAGQRTVSAENVRLEEIGSSSSSSSCPRTPSSHHHGRHAGQGQRCKLIHEGEIQLCRLNHTRTIISKIMNSKYLRRWESHLLILGDEQMESDTVSYLPSLT